MNGNWLALLGRSDYPTDAVEDYCQYLGRALQAHGISLGIERVPWSETGMRRSLDRIERMTQRNRVDWILAQYTALAWSRRGFPLRFLKLLRVLKKSGSRIAVVFHDATPYRGERLADRLRRFVQVHVMRSAARSADLAILTVPVQKADWIAGNTGRFIFIPVGANLPNPERAWSLDKGSTAGVPIVAVFSMFPGKLALQEMNEISAAVRHASEHIGRVQLALIGRHTETAESRFREKLSGTSVELKIHGLCDAERVVRLLGGADAFLFARGQISTRRGSAIAAIACGLPVIAKAGPETDASIAQAGVVLLPGDSKEGFGPALVGVLNDAKYRAELAERSRRAQEQFFSWTRIAEMYLKALGTTSK